MLKRSTGDTVFYYFLSSGNPFGGAAVQHCVFTGEKSPHLCAAQIASPQPEPIVRAKHVGANLHFG